MLKKKQKDQEPIKVVEETLSKTEQFIEKNQKMLITIIGVIVVVILLFVLVKKYYIAGKEAEAQTQIWAAERYFEMDSLDLALNGDGNYIGFVDIASNYKWTKTANLAHYYMGIIYLKQGQYELAIKHLKKFNGKDKLVKVMAMGAIGDAYMELGQIEKAAEQYEKAAKKNSNDFTSPLFYLKAGWAYEELGDFKNAVKMYEEIKYNHHGSNESREIDKYIAKAKALIKE
ncbi:MAG: tetratricopeptide repeat protein [Bacteroidales bacterium]|nr:tetratricopeptide repeat protein [Bacteroidales bacterium]